MEDGAGGRGWGWDGDGVDSYVAATSSFITTPKFTVGRRQKHSNKGAEWSVHYMNGPNSEDILKGLRVGNR